MSVLSSSVSQMRYRLSYSPHPRSSTTAHAIPGLKMRDFLRIRSEKERKNNKRGKRHA